MEETPMYPNIPSLLDRDTFSFSSSTDPVLLPFHLSCNYSPEFAQMIGDHDEVSLLPVDDISSANSRASNPVAPSIMNASPPSFYPDMISPVVSTEPDAAPHAAHSSSGYVDDNYITSHHGVSMRNHNHSTVAIDPPQMPMFHPPQIVAMPSLHDMMIHNDNSNEDTSLCLPPLHISHAPSAHCHHSTHYIPSPFIANSHYQISEHDTNKNTNAADPFANSHSFSSHFAAAPHHSSLPPPPMIRKRESPFSPVDRPMAATPPYHPSYDGLDGPQSMFCDYAEPSYHDPYGDALRKSSFYVAELDDHAPNAPWNNDDQIAMVPPPVILQPQEVDTHHSDVEEEDDDIKPPKKERKKGKRSKNSRKKHKKRVKSSKKRNLREMEENDDDETTNNNNNNKKRKIDKKAVEKYVAETMGRKEANAVFNEMLASEEVVMNSNGNCCYVNGCDKSFKTKCHLKRHVEEAHIGRAFRCTFPGCAYDAKGGVFKQRTQTKEHVANLHFAVSSGWKCFLCDDEFTRWWGVRRHLELRRCKKMKKSMTQPEIKHVLDEMQAGETRGKCKI